MPERLTVHDPATTVRAGGIAPMDTHSGLDEPGSGPVSARTYENPALPGRVVVRLEPDVIAGAADAEMDVLGFSAPRIVSGLGRMRHRTIGFPGWAILHDPEHARFALEVTREFKKAAKRAGSKPGHAKDDFDAIAARLARSVPHFLPSYWEEVGRVFLRSEAQQYASQSFERARQAEKEYTLEVDEKARGAAFLEFTLAGAVSAKSLSAYAGELEKTTGAAEAYERYRELAVHRTLGGMPPWAGMGKELRALARSAGLDTAREDERLVEELIDSPALGRAPAEFWKTYRPALLAAGRRSGAFRKRLLEVFPSPGSRWRDVPEVVALAHFDLLEECGALARLAEPGGVPGETPSEGITAWTGRALAYLGTCDRSRSLLSLLAPTLRQADQPVSVVVAKSFRRTLSLDLCELALHLDLRVAPPEGRVQGFEFEGSTCDPVRTAADEQFGPVLVSSVGEAFGTAGFEALARGKKGLLCARRQWLAGQVARLETGLIIDADMALSEIEHRTTASTFGEFPDQLARLENVRAGPVLARTVRAGLVDELAWPAYEKAAAQLGDPITLDGAFPHLVVRSAARAIVVEAGCVLLEHDLVFDPRLEEPERAWYLDGALLVVLRNKTDHSDQAYWSNEPRRRFPVSGYFHHWGMEYPGSTDLGDRGTSLGERAIKAGDTEIGSSRWHLSDGSTLWARLYDAGKWALREIDPATGRAGRASRPRFLEEAAAAGEEILDRPCWVAPAPRGLGDSPLGVRDGLLGMRMRSKAGRLLVEMIDGTRWEGPVEAWQSTIYGLVRFPAGGHRILGRAMGCASHQAVRAPTLWTFEGLCMAAPGLDGFSGVGWGTGSFPPAEFWHFFQPRDAAASEALRLFPDSVADELVALAAEETAGTSSKPGGLARTAARAAALLPAVKHPSLHLAIAHAAARTAQIASRLRAMVTRQVSSLAAEEKDLSPSGVALRRLLEALLQPGASAPWPSVEWIEWLSHPRARTLLLLSPVVTPDQRRDEVSLVKALASSPLLREPSTLRAFLAADNDLRRFSTAIEPQKEAHSWTEGQSTYVAHISWRSAWVVERNPTGRFKAPDGMEVVTEVRPTSGYLGSLLERCVKMVEERGERLWDPELPARLAETAGITQAEASLLWIGAPRADTWNKDFLGPTARALLGLKVAEADAARGTFRGMPREVLLSLLDAAAPDDPACLTTPLAPDSTGRSAVDRVGAAWRERFGSRVPVPEDLVVACEKELGPPVPAVELFRTLLDPGSSPMLVPREFDFARVAGSFGPRKTVRGFDGDVAAAAALVIPYLALSTPAGDPVAARVPAFHAAIVSILDDPKLLVPLGSRYTALADRSDLGELLDMIGGEEVKPAAGQDERCTRAVDNGLLVAGLFGPSVHVAFRPSRLDAGSLPALRSLAGSTYGGASATLASVAFLRSAGCRAMVERMGTAPRGGAFDANPQASVPVLVEKVSGALGVTGPAATLYLQLLALAEPTARAVQRWNVWTPAQYKSASAELLAKRLLVEGKRERAGRDVFLPGEWTRGTGKNLPTEGWKLLLYESPGGDLSRRLPLEPIPALFERAWRRVEAGDAPKFEEVR
ncbi:MAG: hypothetical protein HY815_17190 [Candidatus Riflebacteria bacterium]|nr:hypothetical protein [Candidatus Riflebacteria bacterium]